jgi:phage host-nuclease inhibitor protein Gam
MATRNEESGYLGWHDVDIGLRRIGEIDIALSRLEGEMTLRINEVRARWEAKAEALKTERNRVHAGIELFAQERKEEFARVRSKELTFGTVAYRIVHRVFIRSKKSTVAAMEALGLNDYLRIRKDPDKEAMKALDAATLAKVGASLKTDDQLSVEPNMERIRGEEAQ